MKLLMLIALILFGYITMASPLEEFSFKEQGYQDFYINGSDEFDCKKYDFVYENDMNYGLYPIFSLNVDFFPQEAKEANVTVYFNDDEILAELTAEDFRGGISRIWLPRDKLVENNNLRVCGKTSFTVNSIKISSDSFFGVYSSPFFPKEDGFKLELETYSPTVGESFTINAVARNYGSEETRVELTYRRGELEENTPEITVLSGETTNTGVVPACEERSEQGDCAVPGEYTISYLVVANRAVPMTLLPAVMKYNNIFGEEEIIQSNRPSIEAFEPKHTLTAQIFLDKDNPFTGETIPIKATIRNTGKTKVTSIMVSLKTGLEIIGEESKIIQTLEAGQSTDITFSAKGLIEGEYALGCDVVYNEKILECTQANISLESQGLSGEVLVGIGFVLIALAVFAYYYFKKG